MTIPTLTHPAVPGREIVTQASDASILSQPPRADKASQVGDMLTGAPDVADTTAVPLRKPLERVANSATTLPGGQ